MHETIGIDDLRDAVDTNASVIRKKVNFLTSINDYYFISRLIVR